MVAEQLDTVRYHGWGHVDATADKAGEVGSGCMAGILGLVRVKELFNAGGDELVDEDGRGLREVEDEKLRMAGTVGRKDNVVEL